MTFRHTPEARAAEGYLREYVSLDDSVVEMIARQGVPADWVEHYLENAVYDSDDRPAMPADLTIYCLWLDRIRKARLAIEFTGHNVDRCVHGKLRFVLKDVGEDTGLKSSLIDDLKDEIASKLACDPSDLPADWDREVTLKQSLRVALDAGDPDSIQAILSTGEGRDIMKELMRNPATRDHHYCTCIDRNDAEQARLLIEYGGGVGPAVTAGGPIPVPLVIEAVSAPDVLSVFLENGADPNARARASVSGITALHHLARGWGARESIGHLIAHGADENIKEGSEHRSPLQDARECPDGDVLDAFEQAVVERDMIALSPLVKKTKSQPGGGL